MRLEDAAFMMRLVNTEGWLRFIGDRNIHSLEDAERYLDKIAGTKDFYYWAVGRQGEEVPIGVVSFLKRTYLEHFDLGFAFLPECQGQGYAQEAATCVLNLAKGPWGHHTVLATTLPDNVRSISLLERLGFAFLQVIEQDNMTLRVYGC